MRRYNVCYINSIGEPIISKCLKCICLLFIRCTSAMNLMDADEFCRNRLLVEGSGGSAPSGAAFNSVAVAPLLVADAVAAT